MSTKLLALAASFREHSLNRQLLRLAVPIAENAGAHVTTLDYDHCDAPIYREEEKGEHLPGGAKILADALLDNDGLLLAVPEYNWSIPGSLKNLIDWLSIDTRAPLNGKTALLMCASPSIRGGVIGLQQLRIPLEHLGMWVYPHTIGVGKADSKMLDDLPAEESLVHETMRSYMHRCITDFVHKTKAMHHENHAI